MKKALLIYNPAAGGWRDSSARARRLAAELEKAGLAVDIARTEHPGHAEELARDTSRQGAYAVFSFGGDGTLRECAAGLLGSSTALGFLPGGTANVMARALGLPMNPHRAAAILGSADSVSLDVGLCGDRPILMQASAGLDASVLARLNPRRKRLLGKAEVGVSLLPAWWSFAYPRFEVRWQNETRDVSFVAACNIPFYGGPWRIAPSARIDDGLLDLVLFSGRGRSATLGFARDLLLGRHLHRSDVETVQVEKAEILPAAGLSLQIDGDVFDNALPATIRLARGTVRFLKPRRPSRPI